MKLIQSIREKSEAEHKARLDAERKEATEKRQHFINNRYNGFFAAENPHQGEKLQDMSNGRLLAELDDVINTLSVTGDGVSYFDIGNTNAGRAYRTIVNEIYNRLAAAESDTRNEGKPLYTLEQLQDRLDKSTNLIAVCESGKRYTAIYSPDYKMVFFTIPNHETIKGYEIAAESET